MEPRGVDEQLLMTRGHDSSRGRGRGRGRGYGRGGGLKDKSEVQCYSCHELVHFSYECPEKKHKALLAHRDDDEPALL